MKSDEEIRSNDKHWPLEMHVGECSKSRAFVYTPVRANWRSLARELSGRVRGPFSIYSTTLPTNHDLKLMQIGDQTIMGTYVTDPCFWSPELSMQYSAELKAVSHDGEESSRRGEVAFCSFMARGKSLYLNGKRWVLRAAFDHDSGPWLDMVRWKECLTGRVSVCRGERGLFSDASRLGVVIVAELISQSCDLQKLFQMACHHVSVIIALLMPGQVPPVDARKKFPNLLLAQRVLATDSIAPWADIAWMTVDTVDGFSQRAAGIDIPIVAERRYHGTSLVEARAAIDTLQADLAPIGQFAGYVV